MRTYTDSKSCCQFLFFCKMWHQNSALKAGGRVNISFCSCEFNLKSCSTNPVVKVRASQQIFLSPLHTLRTSRRYWSPVKFVLTVSVISWKPDKATLQWSKVYKCFLFLQPHKCSFLNATAAEITRTASVISLFPPGKHLFSKNIISVQRRVSVEGDDNCAQQAWYQLFLLTKQWQLQCNWFT